MQKGFDTHIPHDFMRGFDKKRLRKCIENTGLCWNLIHVYGFLCFNSTSESKNSINIRVSFY